jgi:two-component system, NtrC family, sensor kinase
MCATHLVSGSLKSTTHPLETLLVHLAVESHGLDQSGMFRLFCRAVGEYFGATSASCCSQPSEDRWIIAETEGLQPWGGAGDALPANTAERIGLAIRTRMATFGQTTFLEEVFLGHRDSEHSEVAIPFLSHGKLLGAALLAWTGATGRRDESLVDQLTALGVFFAGLLDHAHLFDQVYRSRQQWVRIIDAIPDAIVVHDVEGNIVRINRPLADRVGVHPSKLIGRPIREVLGINRGEDARFCPLCSHQQKGIEGPVEVFSDCSYLVSTTRMVGDLGADAQTVHVLVNIREKLEAERALRRERDFNQSILNHTQNIILVLDASGQIGYVNHRATEIGYSAAALLGLPLTRLIHTSHRPVFQEALRTVLDGGPVRRLELPFLRRNGSMARFVVHLSSMREERGGANSAVVVMTDVTEAALLQAKLAHTEKMAALGQLVSGVAHEVNNPLSAIIGFTDLLLENPELPESAREELGVILQEAERTRLIVQNMLRFAREMPPQREPVQVNLILRQTLKLRSYGLANRNVEIVERLAEDIPVVVADPHQLQQVFLNLLNNAFDAIETLPRRGRIEVETVLRSESVEIYFRDNGPGISNPDRIFEPFFTTKPVGKGTGLGLSICYGIVHAHMGEILCQNNAGAEGCTFLIRLPAAAIRKQAIPAEIRPRANEGST